VNHLTSWFGERVDIDGYFLDPDEVKVEIEDAGFQVTATIDRQPRPEVEYPSRRCYILAQRPSAPSPERDRRHWAVGPRLRGTEWLIF